jgi:phosphatidylserine/phosphatidylglycerophosphate/cardiolipin synthase-like enzyme
MASPFLDIGFENLISAIVCFVGRGGSFLLITRELAPPGSHNSATVCELRRQCENDSHLEIVSWEEEGLGLHLKAAVADSAKAYVGSANFTSGGMGDHAELGLKLSGPSVREIEHLLDLLADELRERKRLQSR